VQECWFARQIGRAARPWRGASSFPMPRDSVQNQPLSQLAVGTPTICLWKWKSADHKMNWNAKASLWHESCQVSAIVSEIEGGSLLAKIAGEHFTKLKEIHAREIVQELFVRLHRCFPLGI
jgi:hypothetical protein